MKSHLLLLTAITWTFSTPLKAQDSLNIDSYEISIHNQLDLRNSSTNLITAQRILNQGFKSNIKPKMNERIGNVTYSLFSFATTYLTMIWSHEFGHSLRAKQVGGEFRIHNVALPIPYTTMHLPESISLVDKALSVTGGFEVNALNIRSIQRDFISRNGITNEDLSFSFANRIMYPLYTSIIVPIDPNDRVAWINTAGDPLHVALPVFENYSNGQVFMPDSTVNPDLVRYYNQSAIFGLLLNFADPQFYRELGAAFGADKARVPTFLIGDHFNGWTFGTLFNVSPLGYELYMQNYFHVRGEQIGLYFKYGNPFKNYGLGISWNEFASHKGLAFSAEMEVWDQDLFGAGIAGELTAEIKHPSHYGINAYVGYKTDGYVLGKQLASGVNLGVGVRFYPPR